MNRKAISSFNVKSKATGHTKANNDKQPKKYKKRLKKREERERARPK